MKFCTECGAKNNDDVNFCVECAHVFPKVKKEKKSLKGLMSEKHTRIAIILGSCLPILLITFFVGRAIYLNANPVLKVLYGVHEMANEKQFAGQASVNLKLTDQSEEAELVEDFGLLVDFKLKEDNLNTKYTLLLEENNVFETIIAVKENTFYLDFLDYYEDVFFYQNDDINEQVEIVNEMLKYLDYMKLKGVDSGRYIKVIEKELKRKVSSEGGMVVVDLDAKDIVEFLEELFDEAKDDEALKVALHGDLVAMLQALQEDDFEYIFDEGGYSEQKFNDELIEFVLDNIEDFDDFEDLYENALEEMVSNLEYEAQYIDDEFSVEMVFDFNMFNKIKSVEITLDLEGDKILSTVDFGKKYKFKRYSVTKSVDIEDVIDDEEVVDVIKEIGDNFIDKFTENEENVDFIEDSGIFEMYSYSYGSADCEDFLEYIWEELIYEVSYMF